MFYEISQEIFKQKLEKQLNFYIIYVGSNAVFGQINLKKIEFISYQQEFLETFVFRFPNKIQNIILFSFEPLLITQNDWSDLMKKIKELGYQFIYYYRGHLSDNILDKGLN